MQLQKETSLRHAQKRKVATYRLLGGSGGPAQQIFCNFEFPRPDFLQFQHNVHTFSDKKGFYWGSKTLQWGSQHGPGGGGVLWPLQYMC